MRSPGDPHPRRRDGAGKTLGPGRPGIGDGRPRPSLAGLIAAGLLLGFLPGLRPTTHSPARAAPANIPAGVGASAADTLSRFVGLVRSRPTGESVGGALVLLTGQERRTVTDDDGRFRLDSLAPGRYEVRIHHLGYTTNPRTVELRPGHSTRAEFWLERTVLRVEDLEVRVLRPRVDPMAAFRRRREDGHGHFLDRGDIEARNPASTSDLLRTLSGVRVTRDAWGRSRVTITRFGDRCRPTVYTDGVLTSSMPVDAVRPESIIAIEVYRGASEVPPQYNPPTVQNCGTILIWTRNPGRTPPGVEPDSSRRP